MEKKFNYYDNRRAMMVEKGKLDDEVKKLNRGMTSWQMKSFFIVLAMANIWSAIVTKIPLIMTCAVLQTVLSIYDVVKDTISAGKIKKIENKIKIIDDYVKEIDEEYEKSSDAFINIEHKEEDVKKAVKKNTSKRKMIEEILNRSKKQNDGTENNDETLTR